MAQVNGPLRALRALRDVGRPGDLRGPGARARGDAVRRDVCPLQAGDSHTDDVAAGACSAFESRHTAVDRAQPELAEGDRQGGRGRDEDSKAKWPHTQMLAAAPDAS
jgi:hypothetical protein